MTRLPERPCLALPFTILRSPNRVRLIAGEDFRYTLEAEELESWLPQWLPLLNGQRSLQEALANLPETRRALAQQIVAHLVGERALIDGPAALAHQPGTFTLEVVGSGRLFDLVTAACQHKSEPDSRRVAVLCQDRLDYEEALQFNRHCLAESATWLWVSAAPLSRGYVSPLFLPDVGPCLECLLNHFRRLSPVAELYRELIEHARLGGTITPTPLPERVLALLVQLLLAKAAMTVTAPPPAALFRLHVLESDTLEITSHRVFLDPECAACAGRR